MLNLCSNLVSIFLVLYLPLTSHDKTQFGFGAHIFYLLHLVLYIIISLILLKCFSHDSHSDWQLSIIYNFSSVLWFINFSYTLECVCFLSPIMKTKQYLTAFWCFSFRFAFKLWLQPLIILLFASGRLRRVINILKWFIIMKSPSKWFLLGFWFSKNFSISACLLWVQFFFRNYWQTNLSFILFWLQHLC